MAWYELSSTSNSKPDFSRTLEIVAAVLKQDSSNTYFSNFLPSLDDEPDKKRWWQFYESKFVSLSECDWQNLVSKVVPRFLKNDPTRKWQTAIDLLNESIAYDYFVSLGCLDVYLVPEAEHKTPDLSFSVGTVEITCEVKTLNRSEESIHSDGGRHAFTIEDQLSENFLDGKLMNTINDNLLKFEAFENTKKLYFFVMNFDDRLHEYADRYLKQIEQFLGTHAQSA